MSTRIFIDCTHTSRTLANTGIQRVVRSVLLHAVDAGRIAGVECTPVVYDDEHFRRVDVSALRRPRHMTRADRFLDYGRVVYQQLRQAAHRALPFDPVHRFLFAPKHRFGLTRIIHAPFRIVRRSQSATDRISFDRDSILLMLDAPVGLDPWNCVRVAKTEGAFVVGTIYDLLPIKLPDLFLPSLRRAFDDWIRSAVRECDALITISRAMSEEIESFLQNDGSRSSLPVAYFPLGFELDRAETSGEVRPEVVELFDGRSTAPVFITVGTLEPRKNHSTILAAFSRLWRSGVEVRLVIVGAVGWKCEGVIDAITAHPELQRRLFWFKDLSDAELAHCYRRAKGTVAASLGEGSGLPLLESLARGLPVVASDIAVFREIGGDAVRYFPVGDDAALAESVRDVLRMQRTELALNATLPGWRDCTATLLERIVSLRDRQRASTLDKDVDHVLESSGLAA